MESESTVSDGPSRLELRPAHREVIKQLHAEGTLVMAGPFPDESGALLIFNVSGADELDRILAADPYYSHPAVHIGRRQEWSPIVGSPA